MSGFSRTHDIRRYVSQLFTQVPMFSLRFTYAPSKGGSLLNFHMKVRMNRSSYNWTNAIKFYNGKTVPNLCHFDKSVMWSLDIDFSGCVEPLCFTESPVEAFINFTAIASGFGWKTWIESKTLDHYSGSILEERMCLLHENMQVSALESDHSRSQVSILRRRNFTVETSALAIWRQSRKVGACKLTVSPSAMDSQARRWSSTMAATRRLLAFCLGADGAAGTKRNWLYWCISWR